MKNTKLARKKSREFLMNEAIYHFGDPAFLESQEKMSSAIEAFARDLMEAGVCEHVLPSMGRNITSVGMVSSFFAYWMRSNFPVVRVTEELATLSASAIESALADFVDGRYKLPFFAMLMEIIPPVDKPDSMLKLHDGGRCSHVGVIDISVDVGHGAPEQVICGVAFEPFWEDGRIVSAATAGGLMGTTIRNAPLILESFKKFNAITMFQAASFTIPYMMSSGLITGRKTTAIDRNRRRRNRHGKKLVVPEIWELDVPSFISIDPSDAGGSSGDKENRIPCRPSVRAQHVVRGHWRNQPCGPGLSIIKETWVRPHWRNVDSSIRVSRSFDISCDVER